MTNDKVFQMNFGKIYGLLLDKAIRKGRREWFRHIDFQYAKSTQFSVESMQQENLNLRQAVRQKQAELKLLNKIMAVIPEAQRVYHLASALGLVAAQHRFSTYYINCHQLIEQLKKAHFENRLPDKLKVLAKYRMLIIDEIGYLPMDIQGANLFFQLIARRYEKFCSFSAVVGNKISSCLAQKECSRFAVSDA